jgi:tetratricopeptide (TPR) repeat protein
MPVHTLTADQVAAANADAATAPDPLASEEARLRGNAAFGAKRFEDAVAAYGEAIRADESNGLVYGNRSAALLALGSVQPALCDAREMVARLPKLPKAHFRLGSALSASKAPAEAAAAFAEALRLEPANEAVAEALRREMARANLKKDKKQARLLQTCQQALAANKDAAKAEKPVEQGGARPAAIAPLRWQEAKHVAGATPAARGGCTLTAAAGRLWLLGGADRAGAVHGDVWEYSPPAPSPAPTDGTTAAPADSTVEAAAEAGAVGWRRHAGCEGGIFSPRSGHAAVTLGASLLVFGGQDPRGSKIHSDLLRLPLPTAAGASALEERAEERAGGDAEPCTPLTWAVAVAEGTPPGARNGHSMTWAVGDAMAEPSVLIFGGADNEGHLGDLHALRVGGATFEWSQPQTTGAAPQPREMHAAAVLPGRAFLIHGGRGGDYIFDDLHVLSLDALSWSQTESCGCPRVGHASVLLGLPGPSSRVLLFGGFNGSVFCNDVWQVVSQGQGVAKQAAQGELPPKRFAHAAAALGNSLYVFGGSAKAAELADLFEADATQLLRGPS